MEFSVATAAEVPAIVALVNSGYRGEGSRAGWTTEADFFEGERTNPAALAKTLAAPGALMLLAREQGRLLGCVYLRSGHGDDGEACYLGMLTIDPHQQARGLGRRLMEAAEEKARERGAARIELRVLHPRTELMAWYERRGYRRTGATAPFPYAEAAAERPTRQDLYFEIFSKPL